MQGISVLDTIVRIGKRQVLIVLVDEVGDYSSRFPQYDAGVWILDCFGQLGLLHVHGRSLKRGMMLILPGAEALGFRLMNGGFLMSSKRKDTIWYGTWSSSRTRTTFQGLGIVGVNHTRMGSVIVSYLKQCQLRETD